MSLKSIVNGKGMISEELEGEMAKLFKIFEGDKIKRELKTASKWQWNRRKKIKRRGNNIQPENEECVFKTKEKEIMEVVNNMMEEDEIIRILKEG